MRSNKVSFLLFMLALFVASTFPVFSCSDDDGDDSDADDDTSDDDDEPEPVYSFCEADPDYIEQLIAGLTLREKIAQMYVVGVRVVPWFDFGDARRLVEEIGVGGVGLQALTGVGLNPKWTVQNTNKLQRWAQQSSSGLPLLISTDQEGGIPQVVSTLTGGTDQPGNMGLGASFDPANTYLSYGIMGRQLYDLGINNSYSPVVGLLSSLKEYSMYTRCFGDRTEPVSEHSKEAVKGFQEQLIIAGVKHFPGHSTSVGDDHGDLPFNDDTEAEIREKLFPPYEASFWAKADMVMVAHTVYTAWEPELPTTFSSKIIEGILRGELGFEGLVVTDDINMGSITNTPWDEHPHVLAIAAGVDLILDVSGDAEAEYGVHPDNEQWAIDLVGQIDAIEMAVWSGRISEQRIDESVRRILKTKMKYCLFADRFRDVNGIDQRVNTPEQIEASRTLHEKAITLVRNDENLLPFDCQDGMKIHVVSPGLYQSEMYPFAYWGNYTSTSLRKEIRKLYPGVTGSHFQVQPNQSARQRIVAAAKKAEADLLVIGTYHAFYYQEQTDLVKELLALGRPTVVVALAMPYDLLAFPEAATYIATYSNRDLAIETAARSIFGQGEMEGRLPVGLPGLYEYGHSAGTPNP